MPKIEEESQKAWRI